MNRLNKRVNSLYCQIRQGIQIIKFKSGSTSIEEDLPNGSPKTTTALQIIKETDYIVYQDTSEITNTRRICDE